ncbi:MAG: helical backbone metal receptor [Bacteroidota bacterium]|nr:helical backbone metal receptor [Bacteroidota bacterium]
MFIDQQNISSSKKYSAIISLVPSQTELLYDLGLENEVIGITKFCVHPEKWFKNKTRIGGTKKLNINKIKGLYPDLIIGNKEENVKEEVEELAMHYDVLVTDVNNLADALGMIKAIGKLTGRTAEAFSLSDKIELKFQELIHDISNKRKIKSAYLIWKEPYMAAGGNTFINDMMGYCGLVNIFTNVDRYPQINIDNLQTCELILLSSEPYPFKEKHVRELQQQIPGSKIILADGEMFSWYGSRLLLAADYFKLLFQKI